MNAFTALKKAVRKAGGRLVNESVGSNIVWQIEAPRKALWVNGGVQWLRVEWLRGDTAWRDDAIQDAIQRLADGLKPMPANFIA